jgi:UDP:flavonoid glycosyltransferase YjiC (YdhE family)
VLALFSPRIASPQPDWPARTTITGFPFFDRGGLSPELESFLAVGPAPVVFTLVSSAVGAARDFYAHSLRAIERLSVRAIFLTGSHPHGYRNMTTRNAFAGSALRTFCLTPSIGHEPAEKVLQRLLSNSAYGAAAATLGEQVRGESGSSHAADAIEAGLNQL